jgi:2,3-dihydroxybenzoate decarboxylase
MVAKIALEEHFLDPATEPYWRPTMVDVAPQKTAQLYSCLTDFGEQRLKMMDDFGIARAVLAVAGPGVQAERDAATAVRRARESNDFLASEVQKRPDRYSGFAHLAMQGAKAAADELERCVRELKFCGAMINGHTQGKYLDDRSYDPFWERAAALDAPIYLHPADPTAPLPVLAGHNVLVRPMWGWGVSESQARPWPSRRDAAVPALALRQPLKTLWLEFAEAAVALPQGERLGHALRHV